MIFVVFQKQIYKVLKTEKDSFLISNKVAEIFNIRKEDCRELKENDILYLICDQSLVTYDQYLFVKKKFMAGSAFKPCLLLNDKIGYFIVARSTEDDTHIYCMIKIRYLQVSDNQNCECGIVTLSSIGCQCGVIVG